MRSPVPLQRRWEYLGGSAGWWEEGENQLSAGERRQAEVGRWRGWRGLPTVPAACWDLGALQGGLPALGGECPAGRGRSPRVRPPAKEQSAAVPGSWFLRGNTKGEEECLPRRSAGRGVLSRT